MKDYISIIERYEDAMKRMKCRAYITLFVCMPLWMIVSFYNGVDTFDLIICIILIGLTALFADVSFRYEVEIKRISKWMNMK